MLGAPMIAVVCGLVFTAIVTWLHVRRRDIHPGTQGVSHYAVGPTHAIMTVAFVALGLGIVSITAAIEAESNGVAPAKAGVVLLWLAALGLSVVAAVPVPGPHAAAWRGSAHTLGALLYFVSIATGAVAVSGPFGGAIVGAARFLAAAVVLFIAGMAHIPGLFPVRGWLQRSCFAACVGWLVLMGWRLSGAA